VSGPNSKNVDETQADRIDELVRAARNEAPAPALVHDALSRLKAATPEASPPLASGTESRSPALVTAAKAALVCAVFCVGALAVEEGRQLVSDPDSKPTPPSAMITPTPERAFPPTETSAEAAERPPASGPTGDEGIDIHALPSEAPASADAPGQRGVASTRTTLKTTATGAGVSPTDEFALELALLREARAALAAGRAEDARSILTQYEKRFPNGALLPEAKAMRIDVLLAAGHFDEARTEAETFIARYPNSPQAGRMKVLVQRKTSP